MTMSCFTTHSAVSVQINDSWPCVCYVTHENQKHQQKIARKEEKNAEV